MRFKTHILMLLWLLAWLVAIDVGISLTVSYLKERGVAPVLSRYFEYGRSIEGKLSQAVELDPTKEEQLINAGWLNEEVLRQIPDTARSDADLRLTAYGQSFTLHAAQEAARIDMHIALRAVGGPGAPPSHSYAAYKADTPYRKADVVLFGVLSSSVPQMGSMSGLFWMFESPAPYTFPRYRPAPNGTLDEELPLIRSESQFRAAFAQRSGTWRQFKDQLVVNDRGYDHFALEESFADGSSLVRLVRRGWVAQRQVYENGVYQPGQGYIPGAEEVRVLKLMLPDLAARCRARGERLVVLLLHTQGHADHLNAVLETMLRGADIDYISTHSLFSANDPVNFQADGHYSERANHLLGQALLERMRNGKRPGTRADAGRNLTHLQR